MTITAKSPLEVGKLLGYILDQAQRDMCKQGTTIQLSFVDDFDRETFIVHGRTWVNVGSDVMPAEGEVYRISYNFLRCLAAANVENYIETVKNTVRSWMPKRK